MRGVARRTWFLIGLGALCVPLMAAAVAYGCTAAAVLGSSPGEAAPGSTVTVTGKYFATHDASPTSASPAQIRLGSVTGPVLGVAEPAGSDRGFTVTIRVPENARAGDTFLSATQYRRDGTPVYGTPARQGFKVLPAPAAARDTSSGGGGQSVNQVLSRPVAFLSLATARRMARARVLRSKRRAKRIRATCVRRSRSSAVCRAKYRLGSKTRTTKRFVVRASSASAFSPVPW